MGAVYSGWRAGSLRCVSLHRFGTGTAKSRLIEWSEFDTDHKFKFAVSSCLNEEEKIDMHSVLDQIHSLQEIRLRSLEADGGARSKGSGVAVYVKQQVYKDPLLTSVTRSGMLSAGSDVRQMSKMFVFLPRRPANTHSS